MSRAERYNTISAEIERCEQELLRGKAFLRTRGLDPDLVSRRGSTDSAGWGDFPEPEMFAPGEQMERLGQSGIRVYDDDDDSELDGDDEDDDRVEWNEQLLRDLGGTGVDTDDDNNYRAMPLTDEELELIRNYDSPRSSVGVFDVPDGLQVIETPSYSEPGDSKLSYEREPDIPWDEFASVTGRRHRQ